MEPGAGREQRGGMPTAVITGASRGLGRALATDLADDGWRLVLDARTAPDLDAVAAALAPYAEQVVALAGDVTDDAHRRALAAAAGDRLDLLVLNASSLGTSPLPPLAAYDLDVLRGVLETNTVAPLALTQLALPALRAAGGRVLAASSDAATGGYPGWGGYGASKAALDQLANVLAAEEPALRVYAVDPGDMRTRMHAEAFPGEDISDRPEPETVVPALRRLAFGDLPSGRYAAADLLSPEDRADPGAAVAAGATR
jgi:NAD(P)-dependent dehydrogenase (short-subunit alcohol dehydrogenase family)